MFLYEKFTYEKIALVTFYTLRFPRREYDGFVTDFNPF